MKRAGTDVFLNFSFCLFGWEGIFLFCFVFSLVWVFFFCFVYVSVLFAGQLMVHPYPLLTYADLPLATWQKWSLISIFFPTLRRGGEHSWGGISPVSSIFSTFGDVCRAPSCPARGRGAQGSPAAVQRKVSCNLWGLFLFSSPTS